MTCVQDEKPVFVVGILLAIVFTVNVSLVVWLVHLENRVPDTVPPAWLERELDKQAAAIDLLRSRLIDSLMEEVSASRAAARLDAEREE